MSCLPKNLFSSSSFQTWPRAWLVTMLCGFTGVITTAGLLYLKVCNIWFIPCISTILFSAQISTYYIDVKIVLYSSDCFYLSGAARNVLIYFAVQLLQVDVNADVSSVCAEYKTRHTLRKILSLLWQLSWFGAKRQAELLIFMTTHPGLTSNHFMKTPVQSCYFCFGLSQKVQCAMTKHFCALVLFECTCDMDHETAKYQ